MKKIVYIIIISVLLSSVAHAGFLDDIFKRLTSGTQQKNDESTIVSGLKEALSVGTENAVSHVSRLDGYFSNEAIKILMPEKIRTIADTLGKIGFQKEVDGFILSMNRAAEKAAPQATAFFMDAIKEMTIEDAKNIVSGGDTAATDYFRQKTSAKLYQAFKPVISSSMEEIDVTSRYRQIIQKYETIPFAQKPSLDLDHYVTNNALEGLFYMVGEEEKKIRTDPAARVTDLLKTVFGK